MTLRIPRKYNPLRIRFRRKGFIHYPVYDIIVINSDRRGRGRFLQRIGFMNLNSNNRFMIINSDLWIFWLNRGAHVNFSVKRYILKFLNMIK